jgi:adenylate kinase family enzyme
MQQRVIIFIGQSGAGKGTQVALVEEKLKALDAQTPVIHLETGKKFRELIAGPTYTGHKTKSFIEGGILAPSFLAIHIWTHELIERYDGVSHMIVDGIPRTAIEVPIILSAATFYGWQPDVIFIDVGDEWAYDKLINRGRDDDKDIEIKKRINWFHNSTLPAIEILKKDPVINFHQVNGEQTIEKVHDDICTALNLT